jgi:hypothetical protein
MTHQSIRANLGELAMWCNEVLANLVEEIVTKSTNLSCVATRTRSERATVRKEGTEKRRRSACTDMIMEGLDQPLTEVLAAVGSNEIGGSGIMKITGVFNLLYAQDPAGFVEFLINNAGQQGEAQKEVFKDAFGREIAEIDGWWRYLVLGTYKVK